MIDIRKLKELVRLMVENELSELDLQDQQETVTIKRGSGVVGVPVVHHAPVVAAPASTPASEAADEKSSGSDDAGLVTVSSPMVGTVYLAPNPETPSFVKTGETVGPDNTVCLIEAMKVFSEIKAEMAGTVERILVSNGQAVQYGQALFMVRPS